MLRPKSFRGNISGFSSQVTERKCREFVGLTASFVIIIIHPVVGGSGKTAGKWTGSATMELS